jgi:aspartyl/asparaginyl-tRNA synthetase
MKYIVPREVKRYSGHRDVALVGKLVDQRVKGGWTFILVRDFVRSDVVVQGIYSGVLDSGLSPNSWVALYGKVCSEQRSPQGEVLMIDRMEGIGLWAFVRFVFRSIWRAIPPNLTPRVAVPN